MISEQKQAYEATFEQVGGLAQDFEANKNYFLSSNYQEPEVRKDFIDKFFIALGWDVNHETQKNPFQQEVKVERGVIIGRSQRYADYAFYVAPNFRDPCFFTEAKKPFGDIVSADNCFQTIRYGWNANTLIAVLTDFEQFIILDCRYRPDIDTATAQVIQKYHYSHYHNSDKFAEIFYLFSHDAVADNSLEKYAEKLPKRRGKAVQRGLFKGGWQKVDESFLEELDGFREDLARNFKKHNPKLDGEMLTEVTHRTLDRLVFLRFLEDKLIETKNHVAEFGGKGNAWIEFIALCRRLNNVYNGVVFRKHDILDVSTFKVDETQFGDLCEELAHINSPYDFNSIPIHILGSIYERFLGKVIVATAKRAHVEEKPEVRKAGGIYYTPDYIVRYIVDNTVGKLIDGKTPAKIAKMHFADIACGSGSFLISIYDLLLRYHRDWYNENPEKAEKAGCMKRDDGYWHLSLKQRREILLTNIYGVDIDHQAVEVAQLSLYLKLLEEETTASARRYQLELRETLLPPLDKNIVCGNSLIDPEILEGYLFPPKEECKLNPMSFEDRFSEVMKQGGFDTVVGNPPYNATLSEEEVDWFRRHFESVIAGRADTAAMFIEKAYKLGAKRYGMLLPYRLVSRKRNHGPFQRWLVSKNNIEEILYLGLVQEIGVNDEFMVCILEPGHGKRHKANVSLDVTKEQLEARSFIRHQIPQKSWGPPDHTINIRGFMFDQSILEKMRLCSILMGEIAESKDGIVPHIREKLISDRQLDGRYKPFVGIASDYELQRYFLRHKSQYICYDINEARKWITDKAELRKVQLRDESIFLQSRKILTAQDSAMLKGTIDESKLYHSNSIHSTYLKPKAHDYRLEYLLALINSKLLNYYHSSLVLKGTDLHPQVLVTNLPKLPIRQINFFDARDKLRHEHLVGLVKQMLIAKQEDGRAETDKDKEYYESKCKTLDRQIDQIVYKLYGLDDDEIKIVEAKAPPEGRPQKSQK